MRITIGTSPFAAQTILVSGIGKIQPYGFNLVSSENVQTKEYLRGRYAKTVNRWNQTTQMTFNLDVFYQTVRDAEIYMMNLALFRVHSAANPSTPMIVTVTATPGITGGALFYLQNAAIRTMDANYVGTWVRAKFDIIGGSVTTTLT